MVSPKNPVELADEDFEFDHGEVEQLAYGYWLERQGTNQGSELDDWLRAEREVRIRKSGSAPQRPEGKHSTL